MSDKNKRQDPVRPSALAIPAFTKLSGKRVVLASSSPRRRDILATVGLEPEIVPSSFEENLPKSEFIGEAAFEYPVQTGAHKAIEVYRRLVTQDDANPPDIVIGADTVVISQGEILEKPADEADQFRMLSDLNGNTCQVVSGVTIVYPIIDAPGYETRSLMETTTVRFGDNPTEILKAYVKCGEGIDRAGGFAIQGRASLLIKSIDGDYNNVVGFPLYSFCAFLHELIQNDELDIEGEQL